jgi:hypothetical protein
MSNRADTCNRADGAIGTPSDAGSAYVLHPSDADWEIGGNAATLSNNKDGVAILSAVAPPMTFHGQFKTLGADFGCILRGTADGTGGVIIAFNKVSSLIKCCKRTAGNATFAAEFGANLSGLTLHDTDNFDVVDDGATATVKVNGSTVGTFTLGTFDVANTYVGLFSYGSSTGSMDSWTATQNVTISSNKPKLLTEKAATVIRITRSAAGYGGSETFTVSGVAGASKTAQAFVDANHYDVTVETIGASPGTLAISDGTLTVNVPVVDTDTTITSGNSTDNTEWDANDTPDASNNVAVAAGHALTISANLTVNGLSVADTASVLVADGVTFNFDTGTAGNAVVQVGQSVGGSELAVAAGGLAIGGNAKTNARLTVRGADSVVASGAGGVVTVTDGLYDVTGSATFSELGDATHYGVVIARVSATTGTHVFSGATFDGTGGLNTVDPLPAGMGLTIDRCQFVDSAGTFALHVTGSAPSGGVSRSITNSSFDKEVAFTEGSFTLTGNVFDGEVTGAANTGSWATGDFDRNFVRLVELSGTGISGIALRGDTRDCYFLLDAGTDNPHGLLTRDTGAQQTVLRCIISYTSTIVGDAGNCVYGVGDWIFDQTIVLPAINAAGTGAITPQGGAALTFRVRRGTYYAVEYASGILIGDGGEATGQIPEIVDSVFWVRNDGTTGRVVTAVSTAATTTPNVVTPAGAHHNLCINLNATRYQGVYSGGSPGADDVIVTGVAVESILYAPDRNEATFAVMMGSTASTYGGRKDDARAFLVADPGLNDVLNTHVRGGMAIINPTYKGRASDGLDHGACRMPTPLEPATASGSTVTIANWSHALNTGVTPAPSDFVFKSGRTCTGVTVGASSVTLTGVSPTGPYAGDRVTHTPGVNKITATDTSQAIRFAVMVNDQAGGGARARRRAGSSRIGTRTAA